MPLETALEGKPVWWGLGIGGALAALIVVGTHWNFVAKAGGINDQIATTNAEIGELDKKIVAGRDAEKKLPQFREEVAGLERELEKLRRILPSSRNTEEIIKKIKALVDQGDFQLRSLTFPDLGTNPVASGEVPIVEWPITVKVTGNYHDLAILFNRLSNFTRIMNVEKFSISALASQEQKTIDSEFVAKTFVYVEPEVEEPTEAAPKRQGAPGGGESGE
ncbi:MAG: type 4a pilus biogenesis protein PilO [Thermoanaerobaculia bacterium]|nr:type 4a pilus biogenesis protein PilO [Thermoanaerobaculia bacterium]